MATPSSHFGDVVSTRAGSVEYSLAYAWSAGTGENNSYRYAVVIRSYNHSDEPTEMPIIHAMGPSGVVLNIVNEKMATEAGVAACRSKLVLDDVSSGILDPGVNDDCLLVFELEAPISDTDTIFVIFDYGGVSLPASLPVPGTEFTSNEG